jgi:hypothetical protein
MGGGLRNRQNGVLFSGCLTSGLRHAILGMAQIDFFFH